MIILLTLDLSVKIKNSFLDLAYTIVGIFYLINIRILSLSYLNKKFFSVLHNENNNVILHPYYITGFSDGESCFFINVRPRPARNKGYAVELLFKITLSAKDKLLGSAGPRRLRRPGLLIFFLKKKCANAERIKNFFGVGRLLFQGSSVSFNVRSLGDLQIIINHFDKFPLISNKYSDYIIFRQVFELMKDGQHLNYESRPPLRGWDVLRTLREGLKKIVSLKAAAAAKGGGQGLTRVAGAANLNKGLPDVVKTVFPDITPSVN